MKTSKKLLCSLLMVLMCLTSVPVSGLVEADIFSISAAAVSYSGRCGDNAYWKYDKSTKTLTITGKGAIGDCHYDGEYVHGYYDLLEGDITTLIISDGITYIGDHAFSCNCSSSIKTLKIADSVKYIGAGAFWGAKIKELKLPAKLEEIGPEAFVDCENLKTLTIPDSVKTIGSGAFSSCTSLEEVTIGSGVTELYYAFGGCEKIKKFVIGKNVKTFDPEGWCGVPVTVAKGNKYFSTDKNGVLYNADKTKLIMYPDLLKLKTYTVPKSVKAISANAFSDGKYLEKVNVSNVEKIGVRAFSCSSIEEIVLGNKLQSVNDEAFYGCRYLKTVTIPASVTKIGKHAFLQSGTVKVAANNKKYSSDSLGVLFNKDKTTLIHFSERIKVKSYTIPDTVKVISDRAFAYNEYVENITFPKGLKRIEEFGAAADNLKSIYLYKDIEYIGEDAFSFCGKVRDLTIEEGSKAVICDGAFEYMGSLENISISSAITEVGYRAFDSSLPGEGKVHYADKILCNVYEGEKNLKIKEGTVSICVSAFEYSDVESITIPSSVRYISEGALGYIKTLKSITVDKNNKHFVVENGVLFNKDKTRLIKYASKSSATEYTVPKTVKTIDDYAFYSASKLKTINIGSNVEYINASMFEGTAMYYNIKVNGVYYYNKNAVDFFYGDVPGALRIKDGTKSVTLWETYFFLSDAVYIPKSVKLISSLPYNVYYEGSAEDWAKIKFVGRLADEVEYLNVKFNFNVNSHKHVYYKSISGADKCFSQITTTFTCPCGKSYSQLAGTYNYHIYTGEEKVTKQATQTSNGVKYSVCGSCGANWNKQVIPKIKSIELSYVNTKYNGKVKNPTVTVKDAYDYELLEGTDYTVKYSEGRKEIGKYYVTVTFKGDYSGTKKLSFNIYPEAPAAINLDSSKAGKVKVTWDAVKFASGYYIYCSKDGVNYEKVATVNSDKTSTTLSGLTSGGIYYFRVRAYTKVGDKTISGALSPFKTVIVQ